MTKEAERAALIARAKVLRAEIQEIFDGVDHWNRVQLRLKGKPIDADPDGELRRIAEGIDRMLAAEPAVVGASLRRAYCDTLPPPATSAEAKLRDRWIRGCAAPGWYPEGS